jgi:hypothetical protein
MHDFIRRLRGEASGTPPIENDGGRLARMLERTQLPAEEAALVQNKSLKILNSPPHQSAVQA